MKLLISGALGRMGRAVYQSATSYKNVETAAGVDLNAAASDLPYPVYADFSAVKENIDVIIDFSAAANLENILSYAVEHGVPAVLCTTGYSPAQTEEIAKAAEKVALFKSANMSVGVNLLLELSRKAAKALPNFDIEIIEKHHNQKIDAPSGTALMLADGIREVKTDAFYVYGREGKPGKRDAREIGIHAVRGGNIVGEHDVLFCGPNETVTLSHAAASRSVFADGALKAALFLQGRKAGLYNMQQLIEEL